MKPLMTHIVAGYPDIAISARVLKYMISQNISTIEIQIPFSDPAADGPVLMQANEASVLNGNGRDDVLKLIKSVDFKQTSCFIMCYYQSLFYKNPVAYIREAIEAGCQGFIVPDLPFDSPDCEKLLKEIPELSTLLIPVISPDIDKDRLKLLSQMLNPKLIYVTARKGITGTATDFDQHLDRTCQQLRSVFPDASLAVGFGIKTKEDVQKVLQVADLAVIGSALTVALTESEATFHRIVRSLL